VFPRREHLIFLRNHLIIKLILCLGVFFLSGTAHADDKNDLVTWYGQNVRIHAVAGLDVVARAEYRTENMTSETNLWLLRAGLSYKFNKWFRATTYGEVNNGKPRFLTEGVFTVKPQSFRFDIRERFTLTPDSWNLRTKLTCTYLCSNGIVEPYTAVEVFTKTSLSQTRVYGGLGFNPTEWLKIKSFYCWRYNKAQLRNDHVLGLEFGVSIF